MTDNRRLHAEDCSDMLEELENLKRKANLMQFCHGKLSYTKKNLEDWVTILIAPYASI